MSSDDDDDIIISQKSKRVVATTSKNSTFNGENSENTYSLSSLKNPLPPPIHTQASVAAEDVEAVAPAEAKSDSPFSASENGKWFKLSGGFRIPALLHEKLYPYQRSGVAWMWSLNASSPMPAGSIGMDFAAEFAPTGIENDEEEEDEEEDKSKRIAGGILADDMGLGKTLQVVSYIAGLFNSGFAECVLIVVPVSLVSVWENEFKKFAANIRVLTLHDIPMKQREKMVYSAIDEGGVVITTYGMVSSSAHVFGANVVATSKTSGGGGGGEEEEEEEDAIGNDTAENENDESSVDDDSVEAILARAKAKVAAVEKANSL